MKRGILYIVWGNYNKSELQRSIDSVTLHGYDYHVAEIADEGIGLAHKAKMYDLAPEEWDTVLFLDTDTIVHGNLDYGFQMAETWSIACCIAPASDAYLASKELGLSTVTDIGLPQINTGVIFFQKDYQAKYIFSQWKFICDEYPKSNNNDQVAFSIALESNGFNPYILPRNWNWRKYSRYESRVLHGRIKIEHALRKKSQRK